MRRILLSIVMCLYALCSVQAQTTGQFPGGLDDDGRGPDETDGAMVYSVTNESEFLAALGNNRTVIIAAGVHLNLSRVLENEVMFLKVPGRRWVSSATDIISKQPLVVSESETDGQRLYDITYTWNLNSDHTACM